MRDIVTHVTRSAMINRRSRQGQLKYIQDTLGIPRGVAKQLYFATLYNAEEAFLRDLVDGYAREDIQVGSERL